jgi:hypothetical protein
MSNVASACTMVSGAMCGLMLNRTSRPNHHTDGISQLFMACPSVRAGADCLSPGHAPGKAVGAKALVKSRAVARNIRRLTLRIPATRSHTSGHILATSSAVTVAGTRSGGGGCSYAIRPETANRARGRSVTGRQARRSVGAVRKTRQRSRSALSPRSYSWSLLMHELRPYASLR